MSTHDVSSDVKMSEDMKGRYLLLFSSNFRNENFLFFNSSPDDTVARMEREVQESKNGNRYVSKVRSERFFLFLINFWFHLTGLVLDTIRYTLTCRCHDELPRLF